VTAPVTDSRAGVSGSPAGLCPCGCGRKLSLPERALGKEARIVGDRIKFLEQYTLPLNLERTQELDLEPKEDLEGFIEQGREIDDDLLAVIHGELRPDSIERASVDSWLQAAHAMEVDTKTALHKTQLE
jgi:hypothetical protein